MYVSLYLHIVKCKESIFDQLSKHAMYYIHCDFFSLDHNLQSSITQQEKDDILNVVHASQCLQECIDVVNVSLGFVQYGQWKPDIMLKRFLSSLKTGGKLPKIVRKLCYLLYLCDGDNNTD